MLHDCQQPAWCQEGVVTAGEAHKDLGTHLSFSKALQIRMLTVNRTSADLLGVAQRARLCHLGDVTVTLSACWCHNRPRQAEILLTNLPETVSSREISGVYLRRRWIELLLMEPISIVGLCQHQVTGQTDRVDIRARWQS
jgi:hypothetical protein